MLECVQVVPLWSTSCVFDWNIFVFFQPGECKIGIMPGHIHKQGKIGEYIVMAKGCYSKHSGVTSFALSHWLIVIHLNLHTEFILGNILLYLYHFSTLRWHTWVKSFLIYKARTLLSCRINITWLLRTWILAQPGHQLPWHWLSYAKMHVFWFNFGLTNSGLMIPYGWPHEKDITPLLMQTPRNTPVLGHLQIKRHSNR